MSPLVQARWHAEPLGMQCLRDAGNPSVWYIRIQSTTSGVWVYYVSTSSGVIKGQWGRAAEAAIKYEIVLMACDNWLDEIEVLP